MSYREENVPRADHVPHGERKENEQRSEHREEPGMDSADHRGRGAQVDNVNVEPGEAEGGPRGSAAWGSEPAGGSVIDKR
jgi:hypothetical protein